MSRVTPSSVSTENSLREEIARVGADLFHRGYTVGSAGNISARLEDGWLITPTDACLGHLDPAALAKVSLDGSWVSGDKPSKTIALHRRVYERNPAMNGVVHTHSTNLVSLSISGVWREGDVLPPITPYYVMKVGHIPLIPYCRPGSEAAAERVSELAADVRGVLFERLGPVVWGATVSQAAFSLEELEETARLWLMSDKRATPLDEAQIDELRVTFGARW